MVEDAWKAQIEALGGFIHTQRKLAQLSLRELADLTSLSNAYLSQVERGLHEPSVRVLKSIATGSLAGKVSFTPASSASSGVGRDGRWMSSMASLALVCDPIGRLR